MLSAAGFGSVDELTDFENGWPRDMIDLMVPVALELRTRQIDAMRTAMMAGIAALLSKGGNAEFRAGFDAQIAEVRKSQLRNRGMKVTEEDPAQQFESLMSKINAGKRPRKGRRHGR